MVFRESLILIVRWREAEIKLLSVSLLTVLTEISGIKTYLRQIMRSVSGFKICLTHPTPYFSIL